MPSKHIKLLSGLAVAMACGSIAAAGWVWAGTELPPDEPPLPVVAAARVARTDLARRTEYTAELHPYLDADLHAKVAGYLKTITVDIGDRVKAGQVIATLDLPEQQADLAKAEADLDVMKLKFDRISAVASREPGLLAQQEIDKARGDYEMAKAAANRTRTMVDYARIVAPFDGVITKRYADPGALIQAGTASSSQSMPVVHLAELARLRLDFPVPQSIAPEIVPGMPVTITIQASGDVTHGVIARETDAVDPSTRMMRVEVDVDNRNLRLKPGMYATVSLELQSASAVLAVPVQSVLQGDQPTVWTIDLNGKIVPREVTLGLQSADKVEILSGLSQGDAVIFGSRDAVHPGMTVQAKFVD
jgi:RND family efflux transporter MFP subunit